MENSRNSNRPRNGLRLFIGMRSEPVFFGLQEIVGVFNNTVQSVLVQPDDSRENIQRVASQAMLKDINHHVLYKLFLPWLLVNPCRGLGLQSVVGKKRHEIFAFILVD